MNKMTGTDKRKAAIAVLLICILILILLITGCGKESTQEQGAAAQGSVTQEDAAAEDAAAEDTAVEDGAAEDAAAEDAAAEDTSHVATTKDMTEVEDVVEEGMVPIMAESLAEGIYPVEMKSSSSMFKADHVELIVHGGTMEAVLYMTSEAYPYMFAGTAEEAAKAKEEEYILPEEVGDGMRTFTLPVNALDAGESFSAFSKKKELWYDRTLLFRADSLPQEAFTEDLFTSLESLNLEDGEYMVEVSLSGGSGRAHVETPTRLFVEGEDCTAEIIWSSSNYDYMRVDDIKYDFINEEGNSTFVIPVSGFDRPMKVYANTTAMSEPHEIEYTLTFSSESIKPAE